GVRGDRGRPRTTGFLDQARPVRLAAPRARAEPAWTLAGLVLAAGPRGCRFQGLRAPLARPDRPSGLPGRPRAAGALDRLREAFRGMPLAPRGRRRPDKESSAQAGPGGRPGRQARPPPHQPREVENLARTP